MGRGREGPPEPGASGSSDAPSVVGRRAKERVLGSASNASPVRPSEPSGVLSSSKRPRTTGNSREAGPGEATAQRQSNAKAVKAAAAAARKAAKKAVADLRKAKKVANVVAKTTKKEAAKAVKVAVNAEAKRIAKDLKKAAAAEQRQLGVEEAARKKGSNSKGCCG